MYVRVSHPPISVVFSSTPLLICVGVPVLDELVRRSWKDRGVPERLK